jgi:hypothetical protein
MAGGRPSSYHPEYAAQVEKLCLLGATDAEIAVFFDVCEATVNNWKQEFPEFLESIKKGKTIADIDIASKLHERACGAEWIEDQAFKIKKVHYDDKGKKVLETEEVITVPVRRAAPPDTTAGIFWLKNRKRTEWRDKYEHTGEDGGPIQFTLTRAGAKEK